MKKKLIVVIVLCVSCLAAAIAWQLGSSEHVAKGHASREFDLDCDFNKFRQIMVRKNATEAIVNHGGMELVEEKLQELQLDTTRDNRPVLNAILGRSQTELDAVKTLTVSIKEPSIHADQLVLHQQVDLQNGQLRVETASVEGQDDVRSYATSLAATPVGPRTKIRLSTDLEIEVRVPKLFLGEAERRVHNAAEATLKSQEEAITQLVMRHANEAIVLPSRISRSD